MTSVRKKRSPISCEPCRTRKIKCPRDSTPCSTCVRRGVPSFRCVFADEQNPLQQSTNHIETSFRSSDTEALAARVRKLEELVQPQLYRPDDSSISVPSSPYSGIPLQPQSTSDTSAPGSRIHGYLHKLDAIHVQFVPCAANALGTDRSSADAFIERQTASIDIPTEPFPFSLGDAPRMQDLLSLLPPQKYCTELKDVYFRSFASVSHHYEQR